MLEIVVLVICILTLTYVSPKKSPPVIEKYEVRRRLEVSAIPFLTTWDGKGASSLAANQLLTGNPLYAFFFESAAGSTKMMVRDLATGTDVWSVTFPGEASTVKLGEGIFLAENDRGQVLWSSPAPAGQNHGSPYYLKVGTDGTLRVTDKSGVAIFSTPPIAQGRPATISVAPVGAMVGAGDSKGPRTFAPQPSGNEILQTAGPPPVLQEASTTGGQKLGPPFLFPAGRYGLPRIFNEPEA